MFDIAHNTDDNTGADPAAPDGSANRFDASEGHIGKPSRMRLEQEMRAMKQRMAALQSESAGLLWQNPDAAKRSIIAKNRILILAAEARLREFRAGLEGEN
jgi:hypothetical protein